MNTSEVSFSGSKRRPTVRRFAPTSEYPASSYSPPAFKVLALLDRRPLTYEISALARRGRYGISPLRPPLATKMGYAALL
jgi:hypothetical protein